MGDSNKIRNVYLKESILNLEPIHHGSPPLSVHGPAIRSSVWGFMKQQFLWRRISDVGEQLEKLMHGSGQYTEKLKIVFNGKFKFYQIYSGRYLKCCPKLRIRSFQMFARFRQIPQNNRRSVFVFKASKK